MKEVGEAEGAQGSGGTAQKVTTIEEFATEWGDMFCGVHEFEEGFLLEDIFLNDEVPKDTNTQGSSRLA